jgi:ABC-2 type transport system permease protein
MTTAVPTRPSAPAAGSPGLAQVISSEWTKLRSVRSTGWSLLALVVATVGFSALISWGTGTNIDRAPEAQRAAFDSTGTALSGISLGQLALAVLGVLVISSEYSTGGIRTSLVAVPRRWRLVAGKAVVFAVVAFVVGTATSFLSFFAGQAFLASTDLDTSLGEPGVLRAVFGGGLYLLGSGMFGFALGTLLRHTPGGIVAAVAGLLVVPGLTQLLPGSWGDAVSRWFTSNAGQQIVFVQSPPGSVGPWSGYLAFTAWWVLPLLVGVVLLQRRDA